MNKNTEDQIAYIAKFQFDELMRSPKDMVTVDLWKKRVFPSDIELCSSALVREDEREACIAECMEQHKASIEAAEKAKRVRDQDAYINTALGAKYSAVRIMQRGVSK